MTKTVYCNCVALFVLTGWCTEMKLKSILTKHCLLQTLEMLIGIDGGVERPANNGMLAGLSTPFTPINISAIWRSDSINKAMQLQH